MKTITGNDFIKRARRHGRETKTPLHVEKKRGKGSHVTLHYGAEKTVVKDRKKTLGEGLVIAMLKQLGLTKEDLGL